MRKHSETHLTELAQPCLPLPINRANLLWKLNAGDPAFRYDAKHLQTVRCTRSAASHDTAVWLLCNGSTPSTDLWNSVLDYPRWHGHASDSAREQKRLKFTLSSRLWGLNYSPTRFLSKNSDSKTECLSRRPAEVKSLPSSSTIFSRPPRQLKSSSFDAYVPSTFVTRKIRSIIFMLVIEDGNLNNISTGKLYFT